MGDPSVVWAEVFERLGLGVVGAAEDGLRYAAESASARIEVEVRVFRDPVTVRVVVRPNQHDGDFLLVPADRVRDLPRTKTGDVRFDEQVAILAGGRTLLPRLGPAERERLIDLVGGVGCTVGAAESTLEPGMAARLPDVSAAVEAIRALVRAASRLATDPPFEEMLERWLSDDGAAAVAGALSRRVVEVLPSITEEQAALACKILVERDVDGALGMLAVMPPYPCVLSAWFRLGDPFDPRVVTRVVEAWRAGAPRPVGRYLAWLLSQSGSTPTPVIQRVWETPGLVDDEGVLKELIRGLRDDPPAAALPYLLQITPRSSSIGRRLSRVLQRYPGPEVDRRLTHWLQSTSAGTREAAAVALADRAVQGLAAGRGREELRPVQAAAERSPELLAALLKQVPLQHTGWLVPFRPHAEPDALGLIRRLAGGGADVDEALLFWLDRGTSPIRLEAARALGAAGSSRVVPLLRDRASGWFSDGGVREACRDAIEAIRRRGAGAAGGLALPAPLAGAVAMAPPAELDRAWLPVAPIPTKPATGGPDSDHGE